MIRPARATELVQLQDLERAAGQPFRDVDMAAIADDEPPVHPSFARQGLGLLGWPFVRQICQDLRVGIELDDRPSDSPCVERVWRSRSENLDRMTSIATAHWTLVIWEEAGQVRAAVQGPETRASSAPVPQDTTFFGIRFALGTTMPWLPMQQLVDVTSSSLEDLGRWPFRGRFFRPRRPTTPQSGCTNSSPVTVRRAWAERRSANTCT